MRLRPLSLPAVFLLSFAVIGTVALVQFSIPVVRYFRYAPQRGDIVVQALPQSALVTAIEGCTQSHYSHCGIIAQKEGKWVVVEAIGPVKETALLTWIRQGRDSRFEAYRLKPAYRCSITPFIAFARAYTNLPYDVKYEMDDEKIYCSELIYKAFMQATHEEICSLVRLGDLNWKPYEQTIRYFEKGSPPLDRKIVTPVGIVESEKVEQVY